MQFRAVVIPSGNATAVEIPDDVIRSLGSGARPPVAIAINGHTWRSRVAVMNGKRLIGISAAHRAAAGIELGQTIDLDITLDTEPREVEEPDDLKAALERPAQCAARLRQFAVRSQGQTRARYRGREDRRGPRAADRQADRSAGVTA